MDSLDVSSPLHLAEELIVEAVSLEEGFGAPNGRLIGISVTSDAQITRELRKALKMRVNAIKSYVFVANECFI